jgi:hypothetical protein
MPVRIRRYCYMFRRQMGWQVLLLGRGDGEGKAKNTTACATLCRLVPRIGIVIEGHATLGSHRQGQGIDALRGASSARGVVPQAAIRKQGVKYSVGMNQSKASMRHFSCQPVTSLDVSWDEPRRRRLRHSGTLLPGGVLIRGVHFRWVRLTLPGTAK